MLRDEPIAPIFTYTLKRLVKPYVMGYTINVLGFYYAKRLSLDPN